MGDRRNRSPRAIPTSLPRWRVSGADWPHGPKFRIAEPERSFERTRRRGKVPVEAGAGSGDTDPDLSGRGFMFSILLALLAVQDPVAPAPVAAPVAEVVTEAAASPAALPVVRVRPIETNSEAGMAAGHSGSATVEVDMQPDGTRGEVLLVESSRSDILDAEAISLITGATLRAPESASRYRIEVVFQPYGFLEMTCRSFALQARWFQQTWPEKSVKDSTLYTASVGLMTR